MVKIGFEDMVEKNVVYIEFDIGCEISSVYEGFAGGGIYCGICSKVFQMGLFGLKCIKGRNGRVDKKN